MRTGRSRSSTWACQEPGASWSSWPMSGPEGQLTPGSGRQRRGNLKSEVSYGNRRLRLCSAALPDGELLALLLAIDGLNYGRERDIRVRHRDIVRLTAMSRSAVSGGIYRLTAADIIRTGDGISERFSGLVQVPYVDRLKDFALGAVGAKQVVQ